MARDIYAEVSAKIISELENGTVPWVKPWRATPGQNIPCNAVTNRPYSGVNTVLLWMAGRLYSSPRYLTYKQAQELGGNVRKGEHGYTIVFVQQTMREENGEKKYGAFMRAYTVFNIDQCDNLPEKVKTLGEVKVRNTDERDATIDEFIRATGADFRETHGDRAFYSVGGDYVELPKFEGFRTSDDFYATAFHELGHWTGAGHRCAREFGKRFGDNRYAAEELVAELSAAFLCAEFNLDGTLQHSSYIASWIKMFKEDKRAFFTAASQAQKAVEFMRQKVINSEENLDIAA